MKLGFVFKVDSVFSAFYPDLLGFARIKPDLRDYAELNYKDARPGGIHHSSIHLMAAC